MSIWDRILGVLAIVLFIALAIGFSHFAEKVNGDDDDLRTKAERAMKELKYREAHSYLEELFKTGEANVKDKNNILLCLEKLREWDKLGPQIDKIIASEKNTFNKGILMAWKAREYKRDSYWSNRGEIVKVYEDSHALIEKRPLNNSEEKIYAAFLLEEIKLKTSQHGYVEWKHVTDAAQRLEKRKVDKETIAEGLLLEADFFAENRDHSNATDYAMVGKYEKIIKDYSETIFAARAHLHFGQFAMSRNAFLKALEHFKAIEDNWKGTKEAMEAVRLRVNITAPRIGLNVERVFKSGEEVEYQLWSRNEREIELNLYKIDLIANLLEVKELHRMVNSFKPGNLNAVATWKHSFASKEGEDHKHQNTSLILPVKTSGAYIIMAKGAKVANRTLILISDLANAMKKSGTDVSMFAANAITGEPAGDAEVLLASVKLDDTRKRNHNLPFDVFVQGKTDKNGFWKGEVKDPQPYTPVMLIAKKGDDYALAGTNFSYYSHLTKNREELFFYSYTDRPVYRPGQKVNFKAVLRLKDEKGYQMAGRNKLDVILQDPRGTEKKTLALNLNEFGTISGTFSLEEECPLGNWTIRFNTKGGNSYARFRVEEYKKPEYEVSVATGKTQYQLGKEISATIGATYFYGEPVKEAEVTYNVYRTHRYWHYRSPDSWDWFYGDSYRRNFYGYDRNLVHQGTGKLDKNGQFKFTFKTEKSDNDNRDVNVYDYSIQATVRDASRRNINGAGNTIVSSHDFNVNVRTDKYLYPINGQAKIELVSKKYDGTAIATQGNLVSYLAEWNRDKSDYDLTRLDQVRASTNAEGLGEVVITLEKEGRIFLQYETADKFDNVINGRSSVYVSSDDLRGKLEGSGGLEMLADKDVYYAGDTAKIMVRSSLNKGWAWFTVEAGKVLESRVVPLETGMNIIDLPINSSHQPNAFVKILVFSQYQVHRQQIEIRVPPVEKFVELTLTPDKAEYKPGEKGIYTVTAKDHKGNPVRGEFSIGVMDASLDYFGADQTPDIRKYFYGKTRSDSVRISGSWEFRFSSGRNEELGFYGGVSADGAVAQKAMAPGMEEAFDEEESAGKREKKKGGRNSMVAAKVRTEFKDSALWLAQVSTDTQGRAVAEITWPDNLTRWRAVARVVTKDTLVGAGTVNVVTRKNLLVRLQTPRFLVQGDKATISLNIHNYLKKAKTVSTNFKVEGLKLLGTSKKEVTVEAGGEARVDIEVLAIVPGEAKITGIALTDEESDAMQLPLPILVHGMEKFEGGAGSVTEDKTVELTLPKEIREGSASLRISVNPTVARTMLESLPYLVQYPYGCVEQTMSRFLPAAVVAKALQDMGYDQPELHKKLPDILKKGLKRLYDFQHSDGGWGWWKNDMSSPYMSAYVVFGLTLAEDIGVQVDKNVLQRGRKFLLGSLESLEDQVETLNFVIFALSGQGKIEEKLFNRIEDLLPKMKEYETALFAVSLANQKQTQRYERVVARLEKMAKKNEKYGTASWGEEGAYYWYQDNVEATALSLTALMHNDPHSETVKGAVRWLMSTRKGGKWKSTRDTAFAIYALSAYMKATEELNPDSTVEVFLNDKSVKKITFSKANILSDAGEILIGADQLQPGKQMIRIVSSGKGNVYYDVFLKYFSLEEPITAASTTIAVDRKYYRVKQTLDADGKEVIQREELKEGAILISGETIEAELTLKSDNIYEYLVYEDFKPAGCEPVERTSGGRWGGLVSNMELRDEKVAFFIGRLPVGQSKISYKLRVEIPGKFHALPVNGYAMYAPDIRAISDEYVMEIKDK